MLLRQFLSATLLWIGYLPSRCNWFPFPSRRKSSSIGEMGPYTIDCDYSQKLLSVSKAEFNLLQTFQYT